MPIYLGTLIRTKIKHEWQNLFDGPISADGVLSGVKRIAFPRNRVFSQTEETIKKYVEDLKIIILIMTIIHKMCNLNIFIHKY